MGTPIGAAPQVKGQVIPAKKPGWFSGRRGRARLAVLLLSIGSLVLLGVLWWIDWQVYVSGGLPALDDTLSAEAAVIGVILAVAGGIVATFTYYGPKAGSGGGT